MKQATYDYVKQLFSFLLLISCLFTGVQDIQAQQKEYFFGVFAENINADSGVPSPGHAFIGIGKGTPLVCSTDGSETEAWGFYPQKKIAGGLSKWFGAVDGEIRNDVYTKIDHQYFIKISFTDYLKVVGKIEEWKEKQYELTRSDCISFVIECCKIFGDAFIVPDRQGTDTPETYIKKFITLNNL